MHMTSTLALLCIALVGTVAADCDKEDEECLRFCVKNDPSCPSFDCGKSKNCVQGCFKRACNDMMCSTDDCTQTCINCQSKMVCSARKCFQTCVGDCEMECTPEVEICQQVCNASSTCKMTCHASKTNCTSSCEDATCTGIIKKPQIESSCDDAGNCSTICHNNCGKENITCGREAKECHLSGKDGGIMKCGSTIEKCVMKCVGNTPCSRECKAKSCLYTGKFKTVSSAMVCQLNYFVFVLFAVVTFFLL